MPNTFNGGVMCSAVSGENPPPPLNPLSTRECEIAIWELGGVEREISDITKDVVAAKGDRNLNILPDPKFYTKKTWKAVAILVATIVVIAAIAFFSWPLLVGAVGVAGAGYIAGVFGLVSLLFVGVAYDNLRATRKRSLKADEKQLEELIAKRD